MREAMKTQEAAPLRGISSMATRLLLARLCQAYAQAGRAAPLMESAGGVDVQARVARGEAFDVVILASDAIDRLCAAGHLCAGSRVDLARSPIALATGRGFARVDLSSVLGLQQALREAKSVGYSTGPSGVYLLRLFESWGMAEQIKAKAVVPPPGVSVGSLIASGRVELGFQQLPELLHVPDVQVLGVLPQPVGYVTTFSAGIGVRSSAQARRLVQDFLDFALSPAADAIKRAEGMQGVQGMQTMQGKDS